MTIFTRNVNEGEKTWYENNGEFWECGVSKFDYVYENDETCVVCSGIAEITCNDGHVTRLEPGVLAYFPKGTACCWNVIQPVTKYFR